MSLDYFLQFYYFTVSVYFVDQILHFFHIFFLIDFICRLFICFPSTYIYLSGMTYVLENFFCQYFVKWYDTFQVQSNTEVYSSFASIYIDPVIRVIQLRLAWVV